MIYEYAFQQRFNKIKLNELIARKILGVDENAPLWLIKHNYLKLAKRFHPDINKNSEELFRDINTAYAILTKKDFDIENAVFLTIDDEEIERLRDETAIKKPKENNYYEFWKNRFFEGGHSEMPIRIAMPVIGDRLSEHFGHAEKFMFFDVEDGKVVAIEIVPAPEHMEGSYPQWIKENNANILIASGIGPRAVDILKNYGITVITNVVPDEPRKIVEDFLANKLDTTYKEVCDHDEHHHHH